MTGCFLSDFAANSSNIGISKRLSTEIWPPLCCIKNSISSLCLKVPLNSEFSKVPVTAWTVAISPPETTSTPQPLSSSSFTNALQIGNEVFHNLKSILKSRGLSTAVGDEGGFAPELDGTEDAINTIIEAVNKAGYEMKKDVMIALDCASSEFYKDGYYDYSIFEKNNSTKLNSNQQVDFLVELCEKYPIISIEDGMDENDWDGWKLLTEKIGDKVQLVGDDLFVTDLNRLSKGINEKIGNSILIKFNQVGSLSETISSINLASENNFTSVISHRSGETEDSTIADLCVAFNTGQIKTGSMSRSDRMSKYNQLLRIEEELGENAKFLGKEAFNLKLS